jgi:hypothetical protein
MKDLYLITGDVLACYSGGLVSRAISWLTPRWRFWRLAPSHVAIIIRHKSAQGKLQTYVYESTTMKVLPDAIHGRLFSGVQAHFIDSFLRTYPGSVYAHGLREKMLAPNRRAAVSLARLYHKNRTQYDMKQAPHAGTLIRNKDDNSQLFCSELVTRVLAKGNRVWGVNPSEMTPWDVIRFSCFKKGVKIK